MDASEIVKGWKYKVLCWLLPEIEPGLPRWLFNVTNTMPPITTVLKIIIICYMAIPAENVVKFELQS